MSWRSDHNKDSVRKLGSFSRLNRTLRDDSGASAAEFAIILPVLMLALFAIIKFGIVINNQVQIVAGTRAASRVLAIGRGNANAYSDSLAAFQSSAPNISVTPTMKINGAVCTATCATLLNAASGQPVTVSASKSCDLQIVGIDFAPGCQLTSQTTERAE